LTPAGIAFNGQVSPIRRRQQQQDGGRVEQQRDHEDEPPHGLLVGGTDERCQIAHWSQVCLRGLPLAVDLGLLDAKIGQRALGGLALLREPIARRAALRQSNSALAQQNRLDQLQLPVVTLGPDAARNARVCNVLFIGP
jgi:hypothetical protein